MLSKCRLGAVWRCCQVSRFGACLWIIMLILAFDKSVAQTVGIGRPVSESRMQDDFRMCILVAENHIPTLGCRTRMQQKQKRDLVSSWEILELSSWLHPILDFPSGKNAAHISFRARILHPTIILGSSLLEDGTHQSYGTYTYISCSIWRPICSVCGSKCQ